MTAQHILSVIKTAEAAGIAFFVEDGVLRIRKSKGVVLSEALLREVQAYKQEILTHLSGQDGAPDTRHYKITPASPATGYLPLSFAQERLWFIHHLHGSVQYHLPWVYRLNGRVDRERLANAFLTIIERHTILRTVIAEAEGEPYAVCRPAHEWRMGYRKEALTAAEKYAAADAFVRTPFDLTADFPLRVLLISTGEEEHMLVGVVHHIAFDGWSVGILIQELTALYQNPLAQLPLLPIQYSDFAAWQKQTISDDVITQQAAYWKENLAAVQSCALLTDFVRPAVERHTGAVVSIPISKPLTEALAALSRQEGVTLFMTLLAAYQVLLYRYTGQTDTCVGTPVAGRRQEEVEGLIGFFVNTLPLRNPVNAGDTFRDILLRVKQAALGAYENQDISFERIVEELALTRDLSRSPIFQVMFALQQEVPRSIQLGDVQGLAESPATITAQYDLSLEATQTPDGLIFSLTYCTALYKAATAMGMLDHYVNLLEAVVADAGQEAGQLSMLTADEQHQLLYRFNDTAMPIPEPCSIIAWFHQQVLHRPSATALVFDGEVFCYRQLDEQSNQLAHYLRQSGIKQHDLIPVAMQRSTTMIITLLAVLKTGAAFIPVDPVFPEDRVQYMLEDAQCRWMITHDACQDLAAYHGQATIINTDTCSAAIAGMPQSPLHTTAAADDLVYTIYTSGSTGKPKGVMIEQRSLVNFIMAMQRLLHTGPDCAFYAVTTFCFDIFYLEMFLPLLSGGKLILADRETVQDGYRLRKALAQHRPTHMQAVPAMWRLLLDCDWCNEENIQVLVGGEAVSVPLKEELTRLCQQPVWNLYGPTETTIWSTAGLLPAGDVVTIGRPIGNTQVYITDAQLGLQPIGVPGELYIGGNGLARGYLNRPELTAEKFIIHSFDEQAHSHQRIYRTGDIAKWLPDGRLVYLGRADEQVKIRGYRIEPGEIEALLLQAAGVRQTVVLAQEDSRQERQLVAFIVPDEHYTQPDIIQYLQKHLPAYMVPAIWVTVPHIPQTPNGKADRKALLNNTVMPLATREYAEARNSTEEMLVAIWQDTLGVAQVGIHDNFFELGGHSLQAMRIISAIRKRMGKEIPVKMLFQFPAIALLAPRLSDTHEGDVLPSIATRTRDTVIPLSFAQERLWFIDRLQGTVQYHMPRVFYIRGRLDVAALEAAFTMILRRHEVLRTVIHTAEGRGEQKILAMDNWAVTHVSAGANGLMDKHAVSSHIRRCIEEPFDLGRDSMLRVMLITAGVDDYVLVVCAHHIAFDGWSIDIMQREWIACYRGLSSGGQIDLPVLPVQYADYAIWQRQYLAGHVLETKLAYWKKQLEGLQPLALPADYTRPAAQGTLAGHVHTPIPPSLVDALGKISQAAGATLFMSMATLLNLLLHRYTNQEDIAIGSPVANRNQPELEGLIGFFVNSIVLRNTVSSTLSFLDLLGRVKAVTMEAYAHQDTPFEKIVEAVVKDRDRSRNPVFQVMLLLQDAAAMTLPEDCLGDGLRLTDDGEDHVANKFDLVFTITEGTAAVDLGITYNAELFAQATIERMGRHFVALLASAVQQPESPAGELPMLDKAETDLLLRVYNDTAVSYPAAATVIDWFEAQVQRTPGATAVVFEQVSLSYQALNACVNQLAAHLRSLGVQQEVLVPVCLNRSINMIAGILGILKAGAAYVPVDPEYPEERIRFMLEDTAAKWILTTSDLSLPLSEDQSAINLDLLWPQISHLDTHNPVRLAEPGNLAYVIYTSGSTGRPKGVMIEHAGLFNRLAWAQGQYALTPEDIVLQKTTFCFDVSVWELIWPLLTGASLVLAKPGGHKDSAYLRQVCADRGITLMHFVPAMLEVFLADIRAGDCATLKKILCSGEALTPSQVKLCKEKLPGVALHNLYGPTEASIDVTYWAAPTAAADITTVPIGKPVANTRLYILDQRGRLMHAGGIGELCIAGIQVARGYLNLPELTAEKFMPDPFYPAAGAAGRMYRTGDLARWQQDGNIAFLGRNDDQVKIRGFRIELGEIEYALSTAAGVSGVKVIARAAQPGEDKQLLGYIQVDHLQRPLLYNYQTLVRTGAVNGADLRILPNGLPLLHANPNEVDFLYREIFAEQCYLRHGISLQADSCVFDVGANIGCFTVFLNLLHPGITVYSFEPIPAVFTYLHQNRYLYDVRGKAFPIALLESEQDISFTYYPQMSIVSGIGSNQDAVKEVVSAYATSSGADLAPAEMEALLAAKLTHQQVTSHARTLSQVISDEGITRIDLLKIDVENSEHLVLQGILDADWQKINSLVVEVHDVDGRVAAIMDMLVGRGFTVHAEKEEILSRTHGLYNLYAVRDTNAKGLVMQDSTPHRRIQEWESPHDFTRRLHGHLEQQLPPYMLPAQWILMDRFPITANGKIDKTALPFPAQEPGNHPHVLPRTIMETQLADLWQGLLNRKTIGAYDDFFECGGHSLLAMRLVAAIRRVLLREMPVRTVFDHPVLADLAVLLEQMPASILPPVAIREPGKKNPLSFYQERLWFAGQLHGNQPYLMPWLFSIQGMLNIPALEEAFRRVIARHEILRTVIREADGIGYQLIRDHTLAVMNHVTAGSILEMGYAGTGAYLDALAGETFDLANDDVLRITLIRETADAYLLFLVVHHIAFDAWSVAIMVEELTHIYNAICEGDTPVLKPLPVQYADYACWQRTYFNAAVLQERMAWWQQQLAGVEPLALLTDFPRPDKPGFDGAVVSAITSKEFQQQLTDFCRQEGVTLFMVLLTALKALLYRYTGQQDICVGTSVAARQQPELESLIGFFVNTLALRSEVEGNHAFRTLLQQVRATTLSAYEYQDVPFEKVVEALGVERELNRNPLFEVILVLENTPPAGALNFGAAQLRPVDYGTAAAKFELTVGIAETENGLLLNMVYRRDLFRAETMTTMLDHYITLLMTGVANAGTAINDCLRINPLTGTAGGSVLHTAVACPAGITVPEMFARQVQRVPEQVALVFRQQSLTYRELDRRANQWAHYLQKLGVGAEQPVPVCMERGMDMLTGILAVMKAGGAYVPVDPDFPDGRIRYILEDTMPGVVLTGGTEAERIAQIIAGSGMPGGTRVVDTDTDEHVISIQPTTAPDAGIDETNLAYMIYTSGSTGQPKGVMIEHRHLIDYVHGLRAAIALDACRSFALVSTPAADLGNTVIYGALLSGATLHICPREMVSNGSLLMDYFQEQAIDCLKIVPSHWKALCIGQELLLPQKLLIFGGEALPKQVAESISAAGYSCTVVNHYGPTETTIGKLLHQYVPGTLYGRHIPIGQPFSDTQVYVLSPDAAICPVGIPGEICIAGAGVARGYYQQPGLTAEKFIANPFAGGHEGGRLYKTGDRGRLLPDGNIEYLGRTDDQVKIRGYRVEPGEIEQALLQLPFVNEAVVLVKEDDKNEKRLAAFVVTATPFSRDIIMDALRTRLPEYMIPPILLTVDAVPLTANGKVNRKLLLDMDTAVLPQAGFAAPRNDIETTLTTLWQELLEADRVGIHDNFFELGGDSIIAIQVVSRARRSGYELQVGDIFEYQTIAGLSDYWSSRTSLSASPAVQALPGEPFGLLPIQRWYLESAPAVPSHFNQAVLLSIRKTLTPGQVQQAIDALVHHHDALRLCFTCHDGHWQQTYGASPVALGLTDLQTVSAADFTATLEQHNDQVQHQPDITRGELLRPVLVLTPGFEADNRLLLVIHHLVIDGVSWRILLEDLSQLLVRADALLPAKTAPLHHWLSTLWAYGQQAAVQAEEAWWTSVLSQYRPLPTDHDYPAPLVFEDLSTCHIRLDAGHTQSLLHALPSIFHTRVNDVLLAALGTALCSFGDCTQVVVGLEGHGREQVAGDTDISRTVGWFTQMYPVLLGGSNGNPGDTLKNTKEQLRRVPGKGMGYMVLKYLTGSAALQQGSGWDVVFNYLGQLDNAAGDNDLWCIAPESAGNTISGLNGTGYRLIINSMVEGGELRMNWLYSRRHYDHATIEGLAQLYVRSLEALVDYCLLQDKPVFTPSDYGIGDAVNYEELDAFLAAGEGGSTRGDQIETMYRLSALQQGMLFHSLYEGRAGIYAEQFSCVFTGLNEEWFVRCWNRLLQQHTILRTAFYHDVFDIPVQCVCKEISLPLSVHDFSHFPAAIGEEKCRVYALEDRERGFRLDKAPLMRLSLLKLGDGHCRMVWTYHHMIMDGWSLPVLMESFLNSYEALAAGRLPRILPEDRYEEYIRFMERRNTQREEAFWREYMAGVAGPVLLPFCETAERNKGVGIYGMSSCVLDAAVTAAVQAFAQQHHITINTLVQGIWAYLLYRYTGQHDIVYGVTVSGRPDDMARIEHRVGMYINTIPLHAVIAEDQAWADWLQGVQQGQLSARVHQYAALNDIQRWINQPGDLFDTVLVYENYPVNQVLSSGKWRLQTTDIRQEGKTNYLLYMIAQVTTTINIQFHYNSSLLPAVYAGQINADFTRVLTQVVSVPGMLLADTVLFSTAAPEAETNPSAADGYANIYSGSIVECFGKQAAQKPDAIALVFEDNQWSYRELDERSNQLAHYLRDTGVAEQTIVPVCMDRSATLIITILAILKAGGTYVPVDPAYPAHRIRHMLEDTGSTLLLTGVHLPAGIDDLQDFRIISINTLAGHLSEQPMTPLCGKAAPDSLACILYTSGSTGNPKGVMVSHSNIVSLVYGMDAMRPEPGDVLLATGSPAFDATTYEYWGTLLNGARLVICSHETLLDGTLLHTVVQQQRVNKMWFTSGWFNQLVETVPELFAALGAVIVGGDRLSAHHIRRLQVLYPRLQMFNGYGPTENTTFSTIYAIPPAYAHDAVPIGRAIAYRSAFVLDHCRRICPPGVPGELYVGGAGLSKGYWRQETLTAERFLTMANLGRLYRTGDKALQQADGNIIFLGRTDDQVKIRGYRVEPGEIEAVLLKADGVVQAAVVLTPDAAGVKRLVAYVVPQTMYDVHALCHHLREHLPGYMVPHTIVALPELPLTGNGKVDRKTLAVMAAAPQQPATPFAILTPEERTLLLHQFNDTDMLYPRDKTLIDLLDEQAAMTPDAPALLFDIQQLSYGSLVRHSNQLAHYLLQQGIGHGMLVPVCMQRSAEMVIALLAVLRTGAGFIPIDPIFPNGRIAYMLDNAGCRCIIADTHGTALLPDNAALQILNPDLATADIAAMPVTPPAFRPTPADTAYVIYTSGSTGLPKGVAIGHQSLVNFIYAMKQLLQTDQHCRLYSVTTFCFDIFYLELFLPLLSGGQVIIAQKDQLQDGDQLRAALNRYQPTHLQAVPVMWQMLVNSGWTNEEQLVILTGGEAISEHLKDTLCRLGTQKVWNLYGPTETTIWSVAGELLASEPVTIGKPIGNTQVYITNATGRLQPIGVAGELLIGGDGLAKAYLNRPDLTDERFAPLHIEGIGNRRLYRTGDLAKWLPDGRLICLGRTDEQLKINGYRIEPGEIEALLLRVTGVEQAVVVMQEDPQQGRRLAGFLVTGAGYDQSMVAAYLSRYIPGYMIPRILVSLPQLPLTPNGKIDRKALQQTPAVPSASTAYEAAQTNTEEVLVRIWQDILGVTPVGIHDNFFELGGDSIIAIQVVSRTRRAGYPLSPRELFEHPTIAGLSDYWSSRTSLSASPAVQALPGEPFGLLPVQRWYLESAPAVPSHFNQAVLLSIRKTLTRGQVQQAIDALVHHHDALRLCFTCHDGHWQQTYGASPVALGLTDLQTVSAADFTATLEQHNDQVQHQPDITRGELLRPVLVLTPGFEADNRLLLVIHHLVIDGVSWRILLEDLSQLLVRADALLPAKTAPLHHWLSTLWAYGQQAAVQAEEAWWTSVLSQYRPLPTDHDYPAPLVFEDLSTCHIRLDAGHTQSLLHALPSIFHTRVNDVLLAALGTALCSFGDCTQVVVGLEGHGREQVAGDTDISRTVGWFTQMYPVLLGGSNGNPGDTLKNTKEQLRRVPGKGMGYMVLKYLTGSAALQQGSGWDVVFNYLGQLDNAAGDNDLWCIAPESAGNTISGLNGTGYRLIINSMVEGGELRMNWLYSRRHYDHATIEGLAQLYVRSLEALVDYCLLQDKPVFTPSDYGIGDAVNYEELDAFMDDNETDDVMTF